MIASFLEEPELEFARGGRHIDIRYGLSTLGPLDRTGELAPRAIRVGVVGDTESVDGFQQWIAKCRGGIEAKPSPLSTLFPSFPGFGTTGAFCDFVCTPQLTANISRADLDELAALEPAPLLIERSVGRYLDEAANLIENTNADVIVCILSPTLLKKIDVQSDHRRGPRSRKTASTAATADKVVWHDLLKARAMKLRKPIQVTRPGTFGGRVQRYKQDGTSSLELQDEATRAWNFFSALYYKAGGIPWRLVRQPSDLTTCYVGISFFESKDHDALQTSVAQVFNERGEGVIVRGGPATIDKDDRSPHIRDEDAEELLSRALELYRTVHRTMPARLVCHKSSYFTAGEKAGCRAAAKTARIDGADLVSIRKSMTRLYRKGSYPPLRGTAVSVSDMETLLYTQGSIDFYRCYPGLYVPRALSVQWDDVEQSQRKLLEEILALTKMNWNSTQFVNSEPITLAASRNVGDILRYLGKDDPIEARYSYYM
jgi:hypothetical protein